jgi:uncharacterized membrane protein YdjX (TVP38/TMEM64 family)
MEEFIYEGEATPILLRKRVVFSLVVGFLVLAVTYLAVTAIFDLPTSIDPEPFKDWVDEQGIWGPPVFIVVMALSVLFAPIPNVPIFIAAGLAWGIVLGSIYSMAGMMLGSIIAFWISRAVGRRHLPKLIGRKMAARLDGLVETFGGRIVFWARMLPVVNFDWISFVAGMTAIRFIPFVIYSFLGMLLPTVIAVWAGDSIGKDLRITLGLGGLWVAGVLLSAMYFWRRHARSRAKGRVTPER